MALLPGWETKRVFITRSPRYGLGMAISGGIDSSDGTREIYISDVLTNGPAEGILFVNDRILSVNGVSLGNVTHEEAIHQLRLVDQVANMVIQRMAPAIRKEPSQHNHRHHRSQSKLDNTHVASPHRMINSDERLYREDHSPSRVNPKSHHPHTHSRRRMLENDFQPSSAQLTRKKSVNQQRPQTISSQQKYSKHTLSGSLNRSLHNVASKEVPVLPPEEYRPPRTPQSRRQIHSQGDSETRKRREHRESLRLRRTSSLEICFHRYSSREDLGIDFSSEIHIAHVDSNSEAYQMGLRRGMLVTEVNGIEASRLNVDEARFLLNKRGEIRLRLKPSENVTTPLQVGKSDAFTEMEFHYLNNEPLQEPKFHVIQYPSPVMRVKTPIKSVSSLPNGPSATTSHSQLSEGKNTMIILFDKNPQTGAGIRLTGGNRVGIFVAGVQPHSPAEREGISEGFQLLKINGISLDGKTKEEAVLQLVSLGLHVELELCPHAQPAYRAFLASQKSGDSFFVRANFFYNKPGELNIFPGFVFHVIDTLVGGVVGSWQSVLVHPVEENSVIRAGIIPNMHRAEQLALTDIGHVTGNGNGPNTWSAPNHTPILSRKQLEKKYGKNSMFANNVSKLNEILGGFSLGMPAYERVIQCIPYFKRPVVIFGVLSDVARKRLLQQFPEEFAEPNTNVTGGDYNEDSCLLTLSSIRKTTESGKHCLMHITPRAAYRLYLTSSLAPIIILMRPLNKTIFKDILKEWGRYGNTPRSKAAAAALAASSKEERRETWKELLELQQPHWTHLFTDIITLASSEQSHLQPQWFFRLVESIRRQQTEMVWLPESAQQHSSNFDEMTIQLSELSHPHNFNEVHETIPVATSVSQIYRPSPLPVHASSSNPQLVDMHTRNATEIDRTTKENEISIRISPPSMEGHSLQPHEPGSFYTQSVAVARPSPGDTAPEMYANADMMKRATGNNRNGPYADTQKAKQPSERFIETKAPATLESSHTPVARSRSSVGKPLYQSHYKSAPNLNKGQPQIAAEATGYFTERGGELQVPGSDVSLVIPPGALPPSTNVLGQEQRIFVKIFKDNSEIDGRPASSSNSTTTTLVSPLVMCGPQGLAFRRPVELRLPNRQYKQSGATQRSLSNSIENMNSAKEETPTFTVLHAHGAVPPMASLSETELDMDNPWHEGGFSSRVESDVIVVQLDHF